MLFKQGKLLRDQHAHKKGPYIMWDTLLANLGTTVVGLLEPE